MRQWIHAPERLIRHLLPALALAILALPGCDEDPIDEIYFASPELVLVRGGDTLYDVALRRAVAAEDLRRWNGLGPDEEVQPGERLLVWYLPAPEAMIAALGDERVARVDAPGPGDARGPRGRSSGTSGADAPRAVMRIAPAVLEAAPVGRRRIEIDRERVGPAPGAGLGAFSGGDVDLDGGIEEDLADRVASLSTHTMERGAQLGTTSLAGGGTAEAFDGVVRERRSAPAGTGRPQVGTGQVRAKRLSMPPTKPCLGGPSADDLTSDDGMIDSQGLTVDQIRRTLNTFVQHTLTCIPSGSSGTFGVVADITVACNGRVSEVWISDGGGLPGNVTGCISATLKYAGFPAHALPDGLTFQYPIQYRY